MNCNVASIEDIIQPVVYHYTSLEKFKSIIENGTFRFKLSTTSNDSLDTIYVHNVIQRIINQYDTLGNEKEKLFRLILNYFQNPIYNNAERAYVTCFTKEPDSRLLWDAYTINRPGERCKYGEDKTCKSTTDNQYNGLCLGINTTKFHTLISQLKDEYYCNEFFFGPVFYEEKQQNLWLKSILDDTWERYCTIKGENDEKQDVIPNIIERPKIKFDNFECELTAIQLTFHRSFVNSVIWAVSAIQRTAPFIKHKFWHEEKEIRAVLCRNQNDTSLMGATSDCTYLDVPINEEIFDSIVTGPSFSNSDMADLKSIENPKINISKLTFSSSEGHDIIRNT